MDVKVYQAGSDDGSRNMDERLRQGISEIARAQHSADLSPADFEQPIASPLERSEKRVTENPDFLLGFVGDQCGIPPVMNCERLRCLRNFIQRNTEYTKELVKGSDLLRFR
jgi:hypothetical protein